MKLQNKTQVTILIALAISIVFLFIDFSVSLGIALGFIFSIINLKLVYKGMDDVFDANEGMGKVKVSFANQAIRFAILAVYIFVSVNFSNIFNFLGIGIGMLLALVGSILDTKNKGVGNGRSKG